MQLVSIQYSEFKDAPKEWTLDDFTLNQITLIVGKNACGKTRTLNIINNLAMLIRGDAKPVYSSANFDFCFDHKNERYYYNLSIFNGKVIKEEFKIGEKTLLKRGADGVGKIFAKQLNKEIDFQTPASDIALTARRDNIQHPFFEPLSDWASSVFHYAFGTPLGRDVFGLFIKDNDINFDPKNTSYVVHIYKQGEKKLGDNFKETIKNDLKTIGYGISDIGLSTPSKMLTPPLAGELMGLWVKEEGLKEKTEQDDISQGMFRALSLIIQVNYSILALQPACVLIDDIGEGLDFERSCSLVKLLLSKVKGTNIQLVMTTNDRFIMNNVPLEMWAVLQRDASHCKLINIHNAKEKFEKFRFTGLNNFDFFATDYLNDEHNK